MEDSLCRLGSVVNRRLFLVFVVSCSLARDTNLAEIPSEDTDARVGRSASLADDRSKVWLSGALKEEGKEKEKEKEEEWSLLKPDPCRSSITAMSIVREEYHIFSGKWFWRVSREKKMVGSDPIEIHLMWYGLPYNLSQVDAVCERTTNGKIVFFIGPLYWELDDNRPGKFPRSGRPLTELGFGNDVKNVDAAFVSPKDDRMYVIAGDRMWKMNAAGSDVEEEVSHVISLSNASSASKSTIDAAFTTFEGKVYFVQGDHFWEESDPRNETGREFRLRNESTIFGCGRNSPQNLLSSATVGLHRSTAVSGPANILMMTILLAQVAFIMRLSHGREIG